MKTVLWTVAVVGLLVGFAVAAVAPSAETASVGGTLGALAAVVAWVQLHTLELRDRWRR